MQLCAALPFIVESIIITVSRWGLGDVYYEFFIFSIITEKNKIKRCRCILFPINFFFQGRAWRWDFFFFFSPASSQAGDLEFLGWKTVLKISTELCSVSLRLRRSGRCHLRLSPARPGSGGVPPPLPCICGKGRGQRLRGSGVYQSCSGLVAPPGMGWSGALTRVGPSGVRTELCMVINTTVNSTLNIHWKD